MNNSDIHNPGPGDTRTPSNDPTGFIYSTYSAAGTEDPIDKAFMKGLSVLCRRRLLIHSLLRRQRDQKPGPYTYSGIRGRIKGFSKVSRRTLLRRFASINRTAFSAFKGRLISVTLTYPAEYPEDPHLCKRHLEAFHKRLERRYGRFAAFWRMGIQKRGAFHFHLLLFVPLSFGSVRELVASPLVPGTRSAGRSPRATCTRVHAWRR